MELLLHVQQPCHNRYRVIRLTYSGHISGEECRSHLASLWGGSQQTTWFIAGTDIRKLVPGQPPFTHGAILTTVPRTEHSKYTPDSDAPLFELRVLHGPDSQTAFPLTRGKWPIGRHVPLLRIQDPELSPQEGFFSVQSTGITYHSGNTSASIAPGEVFELGSSVCLIQPWGTTSAPFQDPKVVELDPPAPRSKITLILMTILPIALAGLIAWYTKLWFILLMACGSSLLMGVHAFSQGKETGQFRRLITSATSAEEAEIQKFRGVEYLAESTKVLLGRGTRKIRVKGKHRDISSLPHIYNAPWLHSVERLNSSTQPLPLATQRLVLYQLTRTGRAIYILIGEQEQPDYLRLIEPLITVECVQIVDDSNLAEIQDGILICSSPVPELPDSLTQFVVGYRTHTKTPVAPGWENLNFDGITAETYTMLLSSAACKGTSTQDTQLAYSATSEIPFFSAPDSHELLSTGPSAPAREPSMYIGYNLDTHHGIELSLSTHGPHFLCAGTTGSGKSQLLRTMLWSLALRNSPQRLSLILIDFKGGAGLGPLEELPHTSLFISDLETAALQRSLKYLRSDLTQREELFRSLGVSSYEDYLTVVNTQGAQPDYPEVVLCIDEFRMLVDSFPDIMNEIMRIATVGRSLGYHLILATQRPQGAISQDIRANISTVLCLRVNSSQDSYNLLESDIASSLPASKPGRGFIRDSENRLIQFQAPLLTGPYHAKSTASCSVSFALEGQTVARRKYAPLPDLALSTFNRQLCQVFAPSSYAPVPPPLTPSPQHDIGPGHPSQFSVDLGAFEIPESSYQGRFSWVPQDGPFLLAGSPVDRTEQLQGTIRQALRKGYTVICCTAFERYAQELRALFKGSGKIDIYSFKDFDFIRFILADISQNFPSNTLLIIDGFDSFLESLVRYPLSESHLLEILQQSAQHQLLVLGTSLTLPRGKWNPLFPHIALTASAVKTDPTRSNSKTYSAPSPGQFSLEGPVIATHGGPKVEAGTLCWPLDAPESNPQPSSYKEPHRSTAPLPQCSLRWKQLPEFCTTSEVDTKNSEHRGRLVVGLNRQREAAFLPRPRGGFMSISGPRGSGKTTCLKAIATLNKAYPMVYVPSSPDIGVNQVKEIIDRFHMKKRRPILLLDDVDRLSSDAQHLILAQKEQFEMVLVAYTPWPRWSSSPILSALNGTATGLVLQPEVATDLAFYPGHEIPLDLKTLGQAPPGRGIVIDYSACYPIQVAFTEPYTSQNQQ